MNNGERPMGAANDKQTNHTASCQPPPSSCSHSDTSLGGGGGLCTHQSPRATSWTPTPPPPNAKSLTCARTHKAPGAGRPLELKVGRSSSTGEVGGVAYPDGRGPPPSPAREQPTPAQGQASLCTEALVQPGPEKKKGVRWGGRARPKGVGWGARARPKNAPLTPSMTCIHPRPSLKDSGGGGGGGLGPVVTHPPTRTYWGLLRCYEPQPGHGLAVPGGGGAEWQPGLLRLDPPPHPLHPHIRKFLLRKKMKLIKGIELEVHFRYTNLFLAFEPPPPAQVKFATKPWPDSSPKATAYPSTPNPVGCKPPHQK